MRKIFIIGMLGVLVLTSCQKSTGRQQSDKDVYHAGENLDGHDERENEKTDTGHSGEIILSPEQAKAAGLVIEQVQAAPFRNVIITSGQIQAAQGDEITIVASVSGVVNFTQTLTEGIEIEKGTGLLSISSDHLQDGDPVQRARITYETAKDEYERAKKLIGSRIVSQKEFNALKENYETARITYEALAPGENNKGVSIKSPINGFIKNNFVKEGDYVTVGQALVSVTQNRRLYLKADVSERYYALLSNVRSANFKTPYNDQVYCLDDLNGRLLSYGKSSGDASYYIPVIFEFDNRGSVIPGSFVEVYLLSGERQDVISLPVSAITEEQGLNFVYIQEDAECYRKQEVKLGATNGDRIEILTGLHGGEKVVTQGAIYVKLASAANTIPEHTHNH